MSKYTEVIKEQKKVIASWEMALNRIGIDVYDDRKYILKNIEHNRLRLEALEIADRLEQADVTSNEEIYIKACRRYGCWESECPYRARDKFCSDLAEMFLDGYDQALSDIRGDAE